MFDINKSPDFFISAFNPVIMEPDSDGVITISGIGLDSVSESYLIIKGEKIPIVIESQTRSESCIILSLDINKILPSTFFFIILSDSDGGSFPLGPCIRK